MTITVRALSTTPIKGTRIRRVESVTLDEQGARGDRAFYVVDRDGAMINGKRCAALQSVVADHDSDGGTLTLALPDGAEVGGPLALGPQIITTFYSTPRPARILDGPWSGALSRLAGEPLRLVKPVTRGVDRGPEGAVSLISRGSLRRLAAADGDGGEPVDPRRFRMLIEIDGVEPHEEDRWVGRTVRVGDAVLSVAGHVGRCVITTRNPETGIVDYPTLARLATYRREEDTTEPLAFGIHGAVLAPGEVRVGDAVALGEPVPA